MSMFKKYSKFYDLVYLDKKYKDDVGFIYHWADEPNKVLDIGCGTASYWKYFPEHVQLTGIEKSKDMVVRHQDKIIHGDIQTTRIKDEFDCAIAMFNVVNYTPDLGWMKNIPLKKGGCFIFDVWDASEIKRFSKTVRDLPDGSQRIIEPFHASDCVILKVSIPQHNIIEYHKMYVHSGEILGTALKKRFCHIDYLKTEGWNIWIKAKR